LKLSNGVLYSLIAHGALILAMLIQVVFYPSEALDLSRAIRVDMIDLPDKITSQPLPEDTNKLPEKKVAEPTPESVEEKKSEPPPEPKVVKDEPKPKVPEKKSDNAVNINKVKNKQKEALNKLKAAAAIEKLREEAKKEEAKPKPVFKGRILSAGTSLTGLDKLQSDSYLSQLDVKIKSHWALPQWLIGKPMRARVHIKLDEAGTIIYKKVTQSSGNQTYDEYCLLAIDKAVPLPQVPEKFANVYKVDGVVIGFPD
jgi:colicin import membrane protein